MPAARVGSLIDAALKRMGLEARCREQRALLIWPEVVGEANARRSWPERVQEGVLCVAAASPAWAQELTLLKSQILERLRARLGSDLIRDIRFTASRRRAARPAAGRERRGPRGPALSEVAADRRACEAIEQLVTDVGDAELRESLRLALLKCARLRVWRIRHGWRRCERCGGLHRRRGGACPVCSDRVRERGWRRLRAAMRRKR
jgi:predicted nucleic acid-binding Zn ribbon protein